MIGHFFINDTLENRISYYLIACFLITLPFDHFYSEWLLITFCMHTVISLKKIDFKRLKNKNIWIIASAFFLSLAAVSYSAYKSEGIKDSFQQLGILLFPASLSVSHLNLRKYKISLLKIFAITCTATILYLYADAFHTIYYFHLPWSSLLKKTFINQNFSAPIGLHATYLSMYATLSSSIFFYVYFKNSGGKNLKYILCIAVLFAGLVQLSSRSALIALAVIFLALVPLFLLDGKRKLLFLIISSVVSLLFIFLITRATSFRERVINDFENDLSEYKHPGDFLESRKMRWDLEWELVQQSIFVGYGTGSEKFILKEKYFENKFYRSYLAELNSHNQYLSFLLNTGIIGLILYLFILCYGIATALKNKDFLLMSFLTILVFVSISENILSVTKGVLFYAFFYSFFLFNIPHKISRNKADFKIKRQPKIDLQRL